MWPWLIGATIVLAALGAFIARGRRVRQGGKAARELADLAPARPRAQAGGQTPASPAVPPPTPSDGLSAPDPVDDALPLTVKFTPGTLRLSLVFVTLQYRLDVTSQADRPLRLRVQADLTSAHGSIDTREQLAPDPAQLELRHDVPVLAPEESVTLEGEVRVPLQDLRMLARGSARFVIPLVRLCLLTDAAAGRRVYTVGPQPSADAPLAPIRIDAGPRTHRELGWREIVAARGFALDPVRA